MAQDKRNRLVIVESPAKARTLGKYLGPGFRVKASIGHIRDLPPRELGVDIENGFQPRYVTIRGKGRVIEELKREAGSVGAVILATDPDREGEAIAYHVAEQLGYSPQANGAGNGPRFQRVLFHEITPDAVRRALERPSAIDMHKFDAQQARRILDRLVGYLVSPLLWKPIKPRLSAGRVQTVALRLIVEREAEIRAFEPEEYWSITAKLQKDDDAFEAKLHHIDGKAFRIGDEAAAAAVLDDIQGQPFTITEIKRRERLKNPPPPFTTSTLQQEAAKRLGFSAKKTMRVAQQLYEGVDLGSEGAQGLITYMRTDSTRVAPAAANAARDWVARSFGDEFLAASPRAWGGKQQKAAQEAHEAIRPTDVDHDSDRVRRHLDKDQFRLYQLIWLRFVAGQMAPAVYDTTTIDFDLGGASGKRYLFRATGSVLKFAGFTRLYQEAREEGDHRTLDDLSALPVLEEGVTCRLEELVPAQHFTQPPPRYSEASLVKELERLGIGRPSTYAQIIATLLERTYVVLQQKRFEPTPLGETVAKFLVKLFPDLFDVEFTSGLETELDRIEEGKLGWREVLEHFYEPFQHQLVRAKEQGAEAVREAVEAEAGECPECAEKLVVRWNRYGRFLGCSAYPKCRYIQSLEDDRKQGDEPVGRPCPECGGELVRRQGRYGPFVSCERYPDCKHTQPSTVPGVQCPRCGAGDVAEKRSRRGKTFWGCMRYPECDWSTWDRPVAGPCPDCGAQILFEKSTKARGAFLRCQQCKGEFAPHSVQGAGAAG